MFKYKDTITGREGLFNPRVSLVISEAIFIGGQKPVFVGAVNQEKVEHTREVMSRFEDLYIGKDGFLYTVYEHKMVIYLNTLYVVNGKLTGSGLKIMPSPSLFGKLGIRDSFDIPHKPSHADTFSVSIINNQFQLSTLRKVPFSTPDVFVLSCVNFNPSFNGGDIHGMSLSAEEKRKLSLLGKEYGWYEILYNVNSKKAFLVDGTPLHRVQFVLFRGNKIYGTGGYFFDRH